MQTLDGVRYYRHRQFSFNYLAAAAIPIKGETNYACYLCHILAIGRLIPFLRKLFEIFHFETCMLLIIAPSHAAELHLLKIKIFYL